MIYLPLDLFSPYIKGREEAINANWNDLNQSNRVEQGWLNNDNQQLRNWFTEDTYGDNLSKSNASGRVAQNQALGTDLNAQIALAGQPGALSQATSTSAYQTALAGATQPYIPQMATNQATYNLGNSDAAAARGRAETQYSGDLFNAQAQNNVNNAAYQGQVITGNQDLLPVVQSNQRSNQQLQQKVNEQLMANPQALFPQQHTAPVMAPQSSQPLYTGQQGLPGQVGPTSTDLLNVISGMPVGAEQPVNVGGQQITAGRDPQGFYYIVNGQKQYLQPAPASPAPTSVSQSSSFTWGK